MPRILTPRAPLSRRAFLAASALIAPGAAAQASAIIASGKALYSTELPPED